MVKLGDICDIKSGGTPSRSNANYWNNGNIPWIKISDFNNTYIENTEEFITKEGLDNSSAKMIKKGSILFTIFATLGEVAILNIDATTNQAIASLTITDESVKQKYLYYFLCSLKDFVNGIGRGVAQNNINLNILKNISVPIPSSDKQNKIIKILDNVNCAIDCKKQQLLKLDELVKSRFIEMFGDPDKNEKGYIIKKLETLANKISDGVHSKPIYTETGKPFISVVNINRGIINFDKCKFVSEADYQKMIKSTHPEMGDVLYTKVGATYGIPAYVDTNKAFCLYVSVCLIKPKSEKINGKFLALSMRMPYVKRQADSRIKGIGVPNLHLNQIKKFDILCPPIKEQESYVAFSEQVDKSKLAIEKSIEKLEILKKSLMQEYFG